MNRCLVVVGIACVLLRSVPLHSQTPSGEETAAPVARNTPRKPGHYIYTAHSPFFAPTGLDLRTCVGYAFTNSGMLHAGRLNLSGVDAKVLADLSPFFGVVADSSYVRAANTFGTHGHADVLSYLAGPVLYPVAHGRVRMYVHGLAGGARVAGPISFSSPLLTGYVNKFSWAVGGGVEYRISPLVALRTGGDYQRTYFYNPTLQIRGQNDFRIVVSVVFSVWQHPRRRY